MVKKISDEYSDSHVAFIYSNGPSDQFRWSSQADCFWLPEKDILCVTDTLLLTSFSTRYYTLSRNDLLQISMVCPSWPFKLMDHECDLYFDRLRDQQFRMS